MSLYKQWQSLAQAERNEREYNEFWTWYFGLETENYKKILESNTPVYEGKLTELAAYFGMEPEVFTGFIDGINTSLTQEIALDTLTEETEIKLSIDFEKLYFNMHEAKADWLYNLTEWDNVLSAEKRNEILKSFRASKVFVKTEETGRNEPCPCGSGKKYKKCCGK